MQKFGFQAMENSRIIIAADRTAADPEDPDHWDKLPRSTRAAAATGKASSSRHSSQDRSEDDSDEEILMYYDPMPLAYAFPTIPFAYPMPSSAIPDDMCHIPKFCRFWYVKRINKLIELFEFV
jgi:hypothetical protein